jgi:hypothetical protein
LPSCKVHAPNKQRTGGEHNYKNNNNIKETTKRFIVPTLEQVRTYCEERKNGIDPESFHSFYESKGWVIGKSPMKSWKAAIITWEKGRNNGKGANKYSGLSEKNYHEGAF